MDVQKSQMTFHLGQKISSYGVISGGLLTKFLGCLKVAVPILPFLVRSRMAGLITKVQELNCNKREYRLKSLLAGAWVLDKQYFGQKIVPRELETTTSHHHQLRPYIQVDKFRK